MCFKEVNKWTLQNAKCFLPIKSDATDQCTGAKICKEENVLEKDCFIC